MELQVIPQNIKLHRKANKLSLPTLAGMIGITDGYLKKLEKGETEPSYSVLSSLADAFKIKTEDLLIDIKELSSARFRSNHKVNPAERILILNNVARWLQDYTSLENMLGNRLHFIFDTFVKELGQNISYSDPVGAAKQGRNILGLDEIEPIYDICGLMEHAGIKVWPYKFKNPYFFGLSVNEPESGPAIIVNTNDKITIERVIFSIAHELGHLLLHANDYGNNHQKEEKEVEKQADLFAGYFLMPDRGFNEEWKKADGISFVERVLKIKKIFKVSYRSVLYRLGQGEAKNKFFKYFYSELNKKFGRKIGANKEIFGEEEPFQMSRVDLYETRLARLVKKAIFSEHITLSRGAEILRIMVQEMMELYNDWDISGNINDI
jgi:Zn-dependent peptidase ImmA (M78 family)/transcriptional regulator with XRE-family HTH domain